MVAATTTMNFAQHWNIVQALLHPLLHSNTSIDVKCFASDLFRTRLICFKTKLYINVNGCEFVGASQFWHNINNRTTWIVYRKLYSCCKILGFRIKWVRFVKLISKYLYWLLLCLVCFWCVLYIFGQWLNNFWLIMSNPSVALS